MKLLLASLKTFTNSKNCSVSRIKFLSFALIGRFFPVFLFSGSQAGYGTFFRDTDGYQKA
jgi:hypothetical protein